MKRINITEPEIIGISGGIFSGRDGMYSNHLSSIVKMPDGKFRIYLCRRFWFDDKTTSMDIGYCDSDLLREWPDLSKNFKALKINGLSKNCKTAHPNVIKKDGLYEMFFWVYGEGMVRYVKSSSKDGVNFTVENLSEPCLYHPGDFIVAKNDDAQGLLTVKKHKVGNVAVDSRTIDVCKNLISNDATCVAYDYEQATYLMYTVHLMSSDLMPERKVEYDNAPGWLRVIHRLNSKNGLLWSKSEPALVPDKDDPVDLQFYSMMHLKMNELQFGILGYYLVKEQVLELEAAICRKNGQWLRNNSPWRLREKLSLDGKPVKMIFPGAIVVDGDDIIISATCCSYLHNQIGKLKPEEYTQANVLFRLPLENILNEAKNSE